MLLRCLQSGGSSGTVALCNGVVSDVVTRSEREKYVGITALGGILGPTLGPLIGGLLIHFQGWRAVFWFLDVYGGVTLLTFALLIPETCRNVVGNGSVPSQRWSIS
jgi:MFS family permease